MSTATQQAVHEAQAFDLVAAFIRQYLVCDDHQLNLLTLWTAYTWCSKTFTIAPYLEIRSPEPQSGKSVCLRLLGVLCKDSAFLPGVAPQIVLRRIVVGCSTAEVAVKEDPETPHTYLFDDCQHTVGPSERQPLVSLLNCGSEAGYPYAGLNGDYVVFGPKAFAGNVPLPRSLASRCIPIQLCRRKSSDTIRPCFMDDLEEPASKIRGLLRGWAEEHCDQLFEKRNSPIQLPPGLTPRQQQCAEPLVRVANMMGGSWPARARSALASAFGAAEYSDSVQLLRDLRTLFLLKDKPETMLTRDLLVYLSNLENRPWSSWGSKSGMRLGALLRPFGIFSQNVRVDGDPLKGYRSRDFQDAWERYTGIVADCSGAENHSATA